MLKFALLLVAGLLLVPQVGEACPEVNGKDVGGVTINVGDYVETGDGVDHGAPEPVCFGETLHTTYTVTISSSCGGGGLVIGSVVGNNLSGTYQVASKSGNCLKLCVCP